MIVNSYVERANSCKNNIAKKLFNIMQNKKTNLAFSADVTRSTDLLMLAEAIGPYICLLKTHIDILDDFNFEIVERLTKIALKHDFLIFEDRKFADIGNTVKLQYQKGIYRISEWADIINAHGLPGHGIIQGLADVGLPKGKGLLLLAEMSSSQNLLTPDYKDKIYEMAKHHEDFVIGFIAQKRFFHEPHWVVMTPGSHFSSNKDSLGQQYITPEQAIIQNKTDIIIVGRGILGASNSIIEAKKYQEAGWDALNSLAIVDKKS